MATLPEQSVWTEGIYQLETSDPVMGGPDGVDNQQAKELANRTKYLKETMERNKDDADTHKNASNPHVGSAPLNSPTFTGTPKAPTAASGTNTTQIATTAFVAQAIAALVGTAPDALNTLEEISAALGGDANIKEVLLNEIAKKADKSTSLEGYGIVDGIKVVGTAPSQKVGDVIYVIDKACFMRWQTIGSWTGYASDGLMDLVIGTTVAPKPNEIDLIGGTYSKSKYPALWAKVQVNNHVVAANVWRDKIFKFVDLGGDNFKVPDLRNTFIRATGFDSDSANVRQLGSYQGDAMRKISGSFRDIVYQDLSFNTADGAFYADTNFVNARSAVHDGANIRTSGTPMTPPTMSKGDGFVFDSSRVVPTSTENRTVNTAFHLRLVSY